MSQPDAIIRIKNLRLRTFIGIKEEEIANRPGRGSECSHSLPCR